MIWFGIHSLIGLVCTLAFWCSCTLSALASQSRLSSQWGWMETNKQLMEHNELNIIKPIKNTMENKKISPFATLQVFHAPVLHPPLLPPLGTSYAPWRAGRSERSSWEDRQRTPMTYVYQVKIWNKNWTNCTTNVCNVWTCFFFIHVFSNMNPPYCMTSACILLTWPAALWLFGFLFASSSAFWERSPNRYWTKHLLPGSLSGPSSPLDR